MNRIRVTVKVDELGRVTIPKIFRDALGIETGTTISCGIDEKGNIVYYNENQSESESKGE